MDGDYLNKRHLVECYNLITGTLVNMDNDLCRVAVLWWAEKFAKKIGRLTYKHFRELLPYRLGLVDNLGRTVIDCNDVRICNEPLLCLKAYLVCRKRWMRKEIEKIAPGTPFAEVARVIIDNVPIPNECGYDFKHCMELLV